MAQPVDWGDVIVTSPRPLARRRRGVMVTERVGFAPPDLQGECVCAWAGNVGGHPACKPDGSHLPASPFGANADEINKRLLLS
jgi:hypothetical protein